MPFSFLQVRMLPDLLVAGGPPKQIELGMSSRDKLGVFAAPMSFFSFSAEGCVLLWKTKGGYLGILEEFFGTDLQFLLFLSSCDLVKMFLYIVFWNKVLFRNSPFF